MRAFFHALGAPFRALLDPEGRRAWALILHCRRRLHDDRLCDCGALFRPQKPGHMPSTLGLAAHVSIATRADGICRPAYQADNQG
jgi:hypothetical protein